MITRILERPRHSSWCRAFVIVFAATILSSCRLIALDRAAVSELADARGFQARQIQAGDFKLLVLYRGLKTDSRLTVYFEGDGFAFRRKTLPSKDPTPKNPLAMDLALSDDSAAVAYIARPCQYLDDKDLELCSARYWTTHRYAEEVLDSISHAVDWLLAQRPATSHQPLDLVGYSGGGAIAALLAARRDDVRSLVTLSANLDLDRWTSELELTPFIYSLNPADQGDELRTLHQLHLVGDDDDRVPPYVAESYARQVAGEHIQVEHHADFDHSCCWLDLWPARLNRFRDELAVAQ